MRRATRALFFITLFTVFAMPAFAVARHWTGQVSANWSEPQNWDPAGVPTAADTLEFPGWPVRRDLNFDLPPGTAVGPMTFLADYTIGGNLMTLTGGLGFVSDPSSVPVIFNNDLKIGNAVRFIGPYQVTVNGTIDVNGQTLRMGTTYSTFVSGPLSGSGTFLVDPRGINFEGGGTYTGVIQGNAHVVGAYPSATFNSPWLTGVGTTGVTTAGLLSPGEWAPNNYHDPHTIGTIHTGPLSITSQYSVDLVPGGASDRTQVTGGVSVAGTLAVTIPSGTAPLPGSSFTILDNDGSDAVSGTFTGLPEGANFTVGSTLFVITYKGGDGNDIVLNVGYGVKTWTGYTSENWSDPSNWSPAVVPQPGEPLLFPPCCKARLTTNNDLTGFHPGLMMFEGEYTLRGNELILTENLNFAFGNGNYVYFTCDAPLKLASSVTFNPSTQQIYNGAIDVNGHTLTIDTYDTKIYNTSGTTINGPISGTGAIVVPGRGIAIRSSGPFSGTIDGIVDIIGSYAGATVNGARVSGNGTLGAVTAGTLAAGTWHPTSPASREVGTLETRSLSITSKFFVDLVAGAPSDVVRVSGSVSVAGVLDVRITGTPSDGETFLVIDNDSTDPISGTFTGLAEGATLPVGSSTFRISYAGGDGNDLVLTHVPAAPAVKTWMGYVNDIWSNGYNWSPSVAPVAGEPLLFASNAKLLVMNNNLAPGFSTGTLTFQNNYTLNGNPLTLTGDLEFANGVAFAAHTDFKLGANVRFHAASASTYSGALDVNGQTLTIDSNNTSLRGAINGNGAIVINGAGVSIASSGTFSGTIAGNADIVGAYPNATVNSARLSGAGSLGVVTAASLTPGSSDPCCASTHAIGTLHTKALSITSSYAVDLVPGGASDQVVVNGTVSLAGALQVSLTGAASGTQSFTIIDNDGTDAVSGTFAGLPEGASLTAGTSTLRITYQGGDGNDVVLSAANERTTTTTISQNRATTEMHQPVTFTAMVTSAGGVPDGSVTFLDGSESIGSATLTNGVAELRVQTLALGSHNISASYAGNASFDASTSPVIVHNVVKGNPHVTITASAAMIVYGDPLSLSVLVAADLVDAGIPTGTVTIDIAGIPFGNATLAANGTATIDVPLLPAGEHLITAHYSGDAAFNAASASITQTVLKAPTAMALESLANPSPVGLPVTVAIEVTPATDADVQVGGNVIVTNGGETITEAQLIANAAAVRVGPLAGGEYAIRVTYPGNENFQPATATLTQHVAAPAVVIGDTTLDERNESYLEQVRVELTEASAAPVRVDYRTVDGSASANADYLEAQGTLVFHPGERTATIPIRILGDSTVEPDETFAIELTHVEGAALAAERVTVVLSNDDQSYRAAEVHDIATEDGALVRAKFYAPVASEGPWPVILWVPGNTAYDGASGDIAALRETARGYAVMSVEYRSAATAPFPAQILDLQSAVRWMRANAALLNINANRIAAWGAGAGGHLAALLGTGFESGDPASRVQAVVTWGAIGDPLTLQSDAYACSTTNWNGPASPLSQLLGCPLGQCGASADAASPAKYANAGDAPMLLMHGRADCFVAPRQSERLYDALRKAGVDATLRIIDFVGHDDTFWSSAPAFDAVDVFLDAKVKSGNRPRAVRH